MSASQSLGEEIANSVSHGLGLVAFLAATPLLIAHAARNGSGAFLLGACVFAATILLLYLGSTLYHALPPGKTKRVFRIIEHSAIYLLIAGTYTPFTLGVLRGAWGWSLLALVWGLAAVGVILEVADGPRRPGGRRLRQDPTVVGVFAIGAHPQEHQVVQPVMRRLDGLPDRPV